jgi:hypothetical protein
MVTELGETVQGIADGDTWQESATVPLNPSSGVTVITEPLVLLPGSTIPKGGLVDIAKSKTLSDTDAEALEL